MTSPARQKKLFEKIRQKRCKNVRFDDLCSLVKAYGWVLDRIAQNNHYFYVHPDYEGAIINIAKPHRGGDVRPYYCNNALKRIQEVASYDDE